MKKIKTVFSFEEVTLAGRAIANVRPHSDIVVQSSPDGNLNHLGTKCEHGVYIPATAASSDHAPYCSVCYPYVLELKS
jgi:hypothetical protein